MPKKAEKVLWFVAGAAIGAGIALLYAPKTGKDTRRYIRRRAEDAKDAIVEKGEQIADKSRDIYKKTADIATDAYRKGAEVASDAADLLERGRKAVGV